MNQNLFLDFKNVEIKQQKNIILNEVNLSINKGEFVYFIGKTGSGKSSLLKAIYGDIFISNGDILFKNQSLRKLNRKKILELRREVGIVFQDFQLLMDRSIADNLRFVMKATGWKGKKIIEDEIEKLLTKVEMLDKANSFPHLISGGEQQRVAIARALIAESDLILADEPTGNLDFKTSQEVITYFLKLKKLNKTIIFATHNRELSNKADYKLSISKGTIKRLNV